MFAENDVFLVHRFVFVGFFELDVIVGGGSGRGGGAESDSGVAEYRDEL